MERIILIGCGGSGKSTLAVRLGEVLGLPVHHLDSLFWRPGWEEVSREEFDAALQRLCEQGRWIIDGNYSRTLEVRLGACDTVIFLDLPTLSCLWGVIRRYWRYRGRSRPDMGSGCPERLNWEFLDWIWGYRRHRRPAIVERLREAEGTKRVIVLRSRAAIREFVVEVGLEDAASRADARVGVPRGLRT